MELFDSYLEQDIDRQTFLDKKAELLGEKKSLAEFLNNFEASQKSWVEPMRNWLNLLGSICKTLSTRLRLWAVEAVDELTATDEMDFDSIEKQQVNCYI